MVSVELDPIVAITNYASKKEQSRAICIIDIVIFFVISVKCKDLAMARFA